MPQFDIKRSTVPRLQRGNIQKESEIYPILNQFYGKPYATDETQIEGLVPEDEDEDE